MAYCTSSAVEFTPSAFIISYLWLSTVRRWDVERHEVRIELDGDLVRDVQAEVRRYRLSAEEAR